MAILFCSDKTIILPFFTSLGVISNYSWKGIFACPENLALVEAIYMNQISFDLL